MSRTYHHKTQTAYFRRMNWTNYCPCCGQDRVLYAYRTYTVVLADDETLRFVMGRCHGCDSTHFRVADERHTVSVQYSLRALTDGLVNAEDWFDNRVMNHAETFRSSYDQHEDA